MSAKTSARCPKCFEGPYENLDWHNCRLTVSSRFAARPEEPAKKHDQGKDRWDLLPVKATRAVVKVLTFGAKKYSDENWRKVLEAPDGKARYYAAAMRHLTAWWEGEKVDPETSLSHLAHAACCVIFLLSAADE